MAEIAFIYISAVCALIAGFLIGEYVLRFTRDHLGD